MMGDKTIIKVLITLVNGEDFFARIFLADNERLQDAMNDNRKFLPIEKHMKRRSAHMGDVWLLTMVHKDAIMSVEEKD